MWQKRPAHNLRVLVIEDGDEYLDTLSRVVEGPTYVQAHTGKEALERLKSDLFDLVYLDMRFDRIDRAELLGDFETALSQHNGNEGRAWRYLQNNQGLFILDALRQAGLGQGPTIVAYDFTREQKRWRHLQRLYPMLRWVEDTVSPEDIRALMVALTQPDSNI